MIHVCLSFQSGHFSEDMIPTVGFNMRKVTKGNVTIKVILSVASNEMKPASLFSEDITTDVLLYCLSYCIDCHVMVSS